ncbi:M50 family metallopeptidase [Pararoseomonas sp. SCSIO 73927]|uniref:M50 family metallopeptidase n=1 Tax=Pararoseomonas sp. SCSIO 73927 TaxID=3114537 RepID=UPI0030CA999B
MTGPGTVTLRIPGLPPLRADPGVLLVPLVATFPLWWGLRGNSPWVAAIVVPGLILSVLAHELGHAITAQRMGYPVQQIRLSTEGGAAVLEGTTIHPPPAITWAGPLVNLALGLALLLAAAALGAAAPAPDPGPYLTPPPAPTGLARRALLWLGWGNILLGAVNLLPAFPLDGGHLLADAIRRRSGPRRALRLVGLLGMVLSALSWVALAASVAAGVPLWLPPDWGPNWDAWRSAGQGPRALG